jgi:hypothetical protein
MVEFFPISLKGKKLPGLISELNEKEITLMFDCRRLGSRTAPWFHWDKLESHFFGTEIIYMRYYKFSNRYFLDNELEFLDLIKEDLLILIKSKGLFFSIHKKVGLFCYCPEKDMKNNLCHCNWISNYLNAALGAF